VPKPIHFRYAWGRNPLANLQAIGNKDLPFATQRSDAWPMEQVPLGVLDADVARPISRGDRNQIIQALRAQDEQRRLHEARQVLEANEG
jgi:sialate O-acetylesterase